MIDWRIFCLVSNFDSCYASLSKVITSFSNSLVKQSSDFHRKSVQSIANTESDVINEH